MDISFNYHLFKSRKPLDLALEKSLGSYIIQSADNVGEEKQAYNISEQPYRSMNHREELVNHIKIVSQLV